MIRLIIRVEKSFFYSEVEHLLNQVKEYFRDNTHKLVQVMTPTETFIEEEQKKFDG